MVEDAPTGELLSDEEPSVRGGAIRLRPAKRGRLDKVLAELLPDVTRTTVQRWIDEGRVRVDGEARPAKFQLGLGTLVEVEPGPPPASTAEPDSSVGVDVIYEDAHLLVVNKPAGLVVHPGKGHATGTLVNGLLARPGFERPAPDPADPEGYLRPGIVHRIDKDTSGLLVVAKDAPTREGLKELFQAHTIERSYLALTIGVPREGRIDTLHGRDPQSRLRFTTNVRDGKRAVTNVRVVGTFAAERAALVECRLETGRTHQIRVHLSEVRRTPILADELYGGFQGAPEIISIGRQLARQALHARTLGFEHPITHESLRFEAALPADMAEAVDALGKLPSR